MNLGKLEKVKIRDIWKDEARDFTPWLAIEKNIASLSDEIGLPIKVLQTESANGRYSLDIFAEEEGTDKKIIIENQFENTNHDHLGKIITYAAGHDASIVIWIFEEIREEHRQAIDWLNEHTSEDVAFFAVKIELWKIGDSMPAPKFQIVSSPNEWTKTVRQNGPQGELTLTKLLQLDFWTEFKKYCAEEKPNLKLQTPRPQHWYDVSIGSSEAHIALTVNTRENSIGCELYITDSKELFAFLATKRNVIHTEINEKVEFIEASKAARIKLTQDSSDIQNTQDRELLFSWLLENTLTFKRVFSKLIKEFKDVQVL
jgi:hypothetical protein